MGGMNGREVKGGDMRIHIADSFHCTMESIVQHCKSNHSPGRGGEMGVMICSPLHHSTFLIMLVLIYTAHSK